ncbi:MAG: acetyltransferase [bacterium]|nr:acetyltransferase [bacterium]
MIAHQKKKLAILGTSLFAPEVYDIAKDTGKYDITTFIENWEREKTGTLLLGKPVIWIDDADPLAADHVVVCSLGTTLRKKFIEDVRAIGLRFETIVHPSARISSMSQVGAGSVLSVGAIIASNTKVGRHVILNRGVLIGHNSVIEDYVTVSPGANIAGAVTIFTGAYIGMGAIILDRKKVGRNSVVAAGSIVTRDVPDNVQVMGTPAKIVKENINGR